ncbi:cytochrome c [uncultured Litoreibacter sp.]|uniref:c-type cytochrome n=1 Tax=uncultured Litoreibacter sp. TaxID=1392394 RepID=UPI002635F7FE|nr:cytochrome c [uncultured Litoreibacter sp.]
MRYLAFLAAVLAAGCAPEPETPDGARLFAENCAGCHGADAKGRGQAATELAVRPADLTQISARNGGLFPMAEVLSTIDGFHRKRLPESAMPEWGLIFSDPTELVDVGDGVMTPVSPEMLAIAQYLEALQEE